MARTRRSSRLKGETPKPSTATECDEPIAHSQDESAISMPDFPPVPTATPSSIRTVTHQRANDNTPSAQGSLRPSPKEMHPQLYHSSTKNQSTHLRSENYSKGDYNNMDTSPSHLRMQQAPNPFTSQTFGFDAEHTFMRSSKDFKPHVDAVQSRITAIRNEIARETPCGEQEPPQANGAAVSRITRSARKAGRFSDAHRKQFNKMASISSNAPGFCTTPTRTVQSASKALKRSRSDIELGPLPRSVKMAKYTDPVDEHSKSETIESPAKRLRMGYAQMSGKKSGHVGSQQASAIRTVNTTSPLISQLSRPTASSSAKTSIPLPNNPACSPAPSYSGQSAPTPTRRLGRVEYTSPKIDLTKTPTKAEGCVEHARTENSRPHQNGTPFKSILRKEPSIRFSNDPAKLAAGTHLSTPKSAFAKLGSNTAAVATPSSPSHRREKHVVFSPEPEIFNLSKRSSSPATPSPAGKADLRVHYPVLKEYNVAQSPTSNMAYPSKTRSSTAIDQSSDSIYKSEATSTKASPNAAKVRNASDFTFRHNDRISFAPIASLSRDIAVIEPSSSTPTNRRVGDTWSSTKNSQPLSFDTKLYTPRTLIELPNVPHGISNKKRKRDAIEDEEEDMAHENKENEIKQHSTLAKAIKEEKANVQPNPAKRIKPSLAPSNARAGPVAKPVKQNKPSSSKDSSTSRNSVATRTKGVLSLSRLNALAQPKRRR